MRRAVPAAGTAQGSSNLKCGGVAVEQMPR